MRREQILKICLNFFLTDEIELQRKDDNSLTFGANDFSEGEFEPTSFAIRFKNKEIVDGFKKAIKDALDGNDSVPSEKQDGESDEKSQLVKKLMLPAKFFDYLNAPDCSGCIGCDPDSYTFVSSKKSEVKADNSPLPLDSLKLKGKPKPRRQSVDKHVSFQLNSSNEEEKTKQLFSAGNVKEKASVFGGGIKKSEGSTNIFATFNSENPPQPSSIFGTLEPTTPGSFFGNKNDLSTPTNSIFSSSLNTTPAATATESTTTVPFGGKPAEPFGGGLFGNKTNFSFGNASSGDNIFGGAKENGEAKPFGAFSSTPTFGSNLFGSAMNSNPKTDAPAAPANIFGSATSTFSFAVAANELDKAQDLSKPTVVPDFLTKNIESGGFAALAANTTPEKVWSNAATPAAGGFFGLTVKADIFSKNMSKQNNPEGDTSQNDESTHEENYDPHYDPIIALPDEINVSTGEEEEEKLYGERAKLFRYDAKTKEWKERGEFIKSPHLVEV